MYILDTDVIIWILRKDAVIISAVARLTHKGAGALSTISVAEIYKNIFPSEVGSAEELFDEHEVISVSREIARDAGYYWQQFHKRLATLSLADCIVAATAKIHRGILLTLNTRHFPMTDIEIKNPRGHIV